MSGLLGPDGRPVSSATFKKAPAPSLGPSYGRWAGQHDALLRAFPGFATLQFDVSRLTLADYRVMRNHPQINASLALLTFMIHQVEWEVQCKDKKIKNQVEENLREVWTRLIRALSQAFWAGYSPNALEFENNPSDDGLPIKLVKVKDLYPEDCRVHWKEVEGKIPPGQNPPGAQRIPPKLKVYDGIEQWGFQYPIPTGHTLWYPLMMENGDYYGRKLLNACFTPWYFSVLIHLFANRYYERFGEPTPIGRAPFEEEMNLENGEKMNGKEVMEMILRNLRSRGTVTLPSDRDPVTKEFDYEIDYLESQMRGADFERYLSRLDEEISMGFFTPLLMLKAGNEGSHNLGVQHTQTYLWMCNALTGDLADYITRYVTERLKEINFTPKAPRCSWRARPMGKENVETLRAIVTELIRGGHAMVDLDEMGQALGLRLTEVREVTEPTDAPVDDGTDDSVDDRQRTERVRSKDKPAGVGEPRATGREISARISKQVTKAFRDGSFGKDFKATPGYRRRFQASLEAEGLDHETALVRTDQFYRELDAWLEGTREYAGDFTGPADFMSLFERNLDNLIESVAS